MKSLNSRSCFVRSGYSVIEVMACVAVVTITAAAAIKMSSSASASVKSTKLLSDVQKLNEVVSVYMANGGTINGTTPQAVIDQLKTVRTATQTAQNVGVMTGRGVDKRLVAEMQSSTEASTGESRALWDNTNKKFYLSTTPGTQGVARFNFNGALAASEVSYDANRAQSNITYNNAVGWVWSPGIYAPGAFIDASSQTLLDQENKYNPLLALGGGSGGGGGAGEIPVLPAPIPSPSSAAYWPSMFPTSVYLNSNGAPDGTSIMKYQVNGGPWTIYTGPFAITPGATVTSKSFSTNPALYQDSPTNTDRYFVLATNFSGSVNAYWSNQTNFNSNGSVHSASPGHGGPAVFVFNQFGSFSNEPAAFEVVTANSLFQLGHLVFHNGNITGAYLNGEYVPVTGSTLLTLHLDITLTQPAGFSGGADVNLVIETNADGSSAKLVLMDPSTNFSFVYGGVNYTLHCEFDNPAPNGSTNLMGAFVGTLPPL